MTTFLKRLTVLSYRTSRLQVAVLFLFSVLAGGLLSAYLGVDSNYDLKKYHIHNAWAFFENRLQTDLFACDLQTYFQPLLDLPYYLLAVKCFPDSPKLLTFIMGIPAGLLIFFTLLATFSILKTLPGINRLLVYIYTGLLGFFGLSGAAFVFQIGSTTNEVQTACLVVAAVSLFICLRQRILVSALVAGALLGVAAGAKLTSLTYTLPFLFALLCYRTDWVSRAKSFVAFSCAWWLAFLGVYGWWGWTLWQLTGNPVFPFFNNIFASDWLPAVNLADPWFRPETWRETLFFPFYWINTRAVSESYCTDVRFLLAQTCVCVLVLFWLARKLFSLSGAPVRGCVGETQGLFRSRLFQFILIFLVGSFIFWEKQFSILRYLIPVAVFLGLLVFLCVAYIAAYFGIREKHGKHLFILSLLAFLTVVSTATTRHPHWGRLRGEKTVFDVSQLPVLRENTMVVFGGPETQFLAPFIAEKNKGVVFVSLGGDPRLMLDKLGDSKLTRMLKEKIAAHKGPVCVLISDGYRGNAVYMSRVGLSLESNLSQYFETNYDSFRLYFAQRVSDTAETVLAERAFFIRNIMSHFETRWEAGTAGVFASGWGRVEKKDGRAFRWSEGAASALTFFVRGTSGFSGRLLLRGFPRGKQRAVVKLNGVEIYNGIIGAGGFPEISIPKGVLRPVELGENRLEFQWPDALLFDNRPWPDGPRPGFGDRRLVAFAFESAEIQ